MWRSIPALIVLAGCGRLWFDPRDDGGDGAGPSGPGFVDVAAANVHTCAAATNGKLKCWGSNTWGKLGIGSADASPRGDQPGELAALPSVDLGTNAEIRA